MKTLAVFLCLLLAPVLAHAGLEDFITKAAVIGALFILGVITSPAAAIFAIAMTAYGEYKSDELKRQTEEQARAAKDSYNSSLKDRTITAVGSDAPYVYVYGRARVGSAVVAILPSGPRDEYQHIIAIHAAHECDGFEEVYIGKKALGELDDEGYAVNSPDYAKSIKTFVDTQGQTSWDIRDDFIAGTVSVLEQIVDSENQTQFVTKAFSQVGNTITVDFPGNYRTQYSYRSATVRVIKHLGTPGEAADATLIAECPDKWTALSKLSGFCYTYIRLDLNQQEFQGGLVGIEVLLRGKKLYDPRTDTTAWSQNVALVLNDYLQGDCCGVPAADIPTADLVTAADICDEVIDIGARYTFNGTITSEQSQPTVIGQIAQAMAGGINSTTWEMWAGKYVAPTLALEQADIVGAVGITPGLSDADIFNGAVARFISAENDYADTDMVPYQNAVYRAADGRDLFANMEFPFTDETQRCHNLARIYVEDQRNGFTVKALFSLKAWDTKIGQRVTLNAAFFGFSNKVFRIVGKTYSYNGAVELLLKEDAPEIWDLADAVVVDATPNSDLPNPFLLDPPASLSLSSGTDALLRQADGTVVSRIKASWPAGATIYAAQAELQIKPIASNQWQTAAMVDATLSLAYLAPVKDGETYDTRIRYVNPRLSVQSPWAYGAPHTVVGKTQAPSAPSKVAVVGQQIYWLAVTDADRAGYLLRAIAGRDAVWSSGQPLHTGLVTATPFSLPVRLFGVQTIMVRTVDSSGNESEVASVTHNFGLASLDNIVQAYDYQANGFPGSYTDCSISGGSLVADLDPDASLYALADVYANSDNYAATYLPMIWESQVFVPRYNGIVTLVVQAQGGMTVEYRVDGSTSNDLYSEADVYASADLFQSLDEWQPWPGALQVQRGHGLIWRISLDGGSVRGELQAADAYFTMNAVRQTFSNKAISASGTRLSPASGTPAYDGWLEITTVQLTPFADVGGAVSPQILDMSPDQGPFVQLLNSSDVAVNGRATIEIGGLVDV